MVDGLLFLIIHNESVYKFDSKFEDTWLRIFCVCMNAYLLKLTLVGKVVDGF